jgi:hypothetical protein
MEGGFVKKRGQDYPRVALLLKSEGLVLRKKFLKIEQYFAISNGCDVEWPHELQRIISGSII